MYVRRTLPHRRLRTIGPFCFVDHYGPSPTSGDDAHPWWFLRTPIPVCRLCRGCCREPSTTATAWDLFSASAPVELNLMTAGNGIAHSEYSVGDDTALHGVQLWIALPDAARHEEPHFEHHGDLPHVVGDGLGARVVMGSLLGEESKARTYSPLICAELALSAGRHRCRSTATFEHGVLALSGAVERRRSARRARLPALHAPGVEEHSSSSPESEATVLLIGGVPFDEELLMWWNFVGRTHDDIAQARADWVVGLERGSESSPTTTTLRCTRPQLPRYSCCRGRSARSDACDASSAENLGLLCRELLVGQDARGVQLTELLELRDGVRRCRCGRGRRVLLLGLRGPARPLVGLAPGDVVGDVRCGSGNDCGAGYPADQSWHEVSS